MQYVVYGITTLFCVWVGYEMVNLIIGSIKDSKNGKS